MDVNGIIRQWLEANGYDALIGACDFGCKADGSGPCGGICARCEPAIWLDCSECDERGRCKISLDHVVGAVNPGHCKMAKLKDAPDGQLFRRVASNGGRGYSFVPIEKADAPVREDAPNGCPTHYARDGFEAVEFIERALGILSAADVAWRESWILGNALKYALRAGAKGDWREDADKCADYLCRALTGDFANAKKIPGGD